MVEYGKALSRGLKFGIKPKRWLQFFVLDLVFLCIGLAVFLPNLSEIITLIGGYSQDMTGVLSMAGIGISILVVFVVWMLVRLWLMGAVVHQSYKEKDSIGKSFDTAGRKYLHILLTIIIVTIITAAVGMVPYVGWLLTFVFGWIFFFVLQGIIVSNMGFEKTITNSWKIFRNKPLQVFIAWLSIAVITLVINVIFAIPLILLFFGIIFSLAPLYMGGQVIPPEAMVSLSQTLQANLPALIVVGIIALAGFAISQVFALKAQTEFYQQLKRKKFGII